MVHRGNIQFGQTLADGQFKLKEGASFLSVSEADKPLDGKLILDRSYINARKKFMPSISSGFIILLGYQKVSFDVFLFA